MLLIPSLTQASPGGPALRSATILEIRKDNGTISGMKHILSALALSALTATGALADPIFKAPPPAKGFSYPDCFCTNRGEKVPIGKMSCLRIGSQTFTARCGMSLNNPAWRDMKPGCDTPVSSAPDVQSEFLQPG